MLRVCYFLLILNEQLAHTAPDVELSGIISTRAAATDCQTLL